MVMVESANAAQGISHYLNQGQQKWALQAWCSAIIVTVLEVRFAYRCSVRRSVKAIIPYSAEGRKKSYKVPVCSIWRWPELILTNAHSARHKHSYSHLHPSTNTHSHRLPVFFKCQHALSTCRPESVCLYVREGHAHGQCCLLLMHGWLRHLSAP